MQSSLYRDKKWFGKSAKMAEKTTETVSTFYLYFQDRVRRGRSRLYMSQSIDIDIYSIDI